MLSPIQAFVDTVYSDKPQTTAEHCMTLPLKLLIFLSLPLLFVFVCSGMEGMWYIRVMFGGTYPIMIALLLLMALIFLHGYLYAVRLEKAVRKGTRFQGKIIKEKRIRHGGVKNSYYTYQIWVTLDDGNVVKSPSYMRYEKSYQTCEVYLYHRRYYFTNFRHKRF